MNRAQRNHNPLNIRRTADQWHGARNEQTDPEFVQFESDAWGYRAAWKVLDTYAKLFRQEDKPFCIRNIIARWAPPTENDTQTYTRTVARLACIGGNELLLPPANPRSYLKLARIIEAMTCVEGGIPMKMVNTEAVCQGYRLAFPTKSALLDRVRRGLDEYSDWSQ